MNKATKTFLILALVYAMICCDFMSVKSKSITEINSLGQRSRRLRKQRAVRRARQRFRR